MNYSILNNWVKFRKTLLKMILLMLNQFYQSEDSLKFENVPKVSRWTTKISNKLNIKFI